MNLANETSGALARVEEVTIGTPVSDILYEGWQNESEASCFPMSLAGLRCPRAVFHHAEGNLCRPGTSDEGDDADARTVIQRAIDHVMSDADCHVKAQYPIAIHHRDIVARGVADLVLLADGVTVVRLIPANVDLWDRIADRELGEHRGEANLLAHGLSAKHWSICYVRIGSGEIREHVGRTNRIAAEWSLDRFVEVAQARRKKTPPLCPIERADRGKDPCECRWSRAAI